MKELIAIQTQLKAPKGQYNSFGKYHYRSCEDIVEAVKPLMHKHGCFLTMSDEVVREGERYYIRATVTITNSEGQSVSATAMAREDETKKGMDGSQITGSSSSYARKYALNGLFAIDDTKDSDALNTGAVDYGMKLRECASIEELQAVWKAIPIKTPYQTIKDEMKTKLTAQQ